MSTQYSAALQLRDVAATILDGAQANIRQFLHTLAKSMLVKYPQARQRGGIVLSKHTTPMCEVLHGLLEQNLRSALTLTVNNGSGTSCAYLHHAVSEIVACICETKRSGIPTLITPLLHRACFVPCTSAEPNQDGKTLVQLLLRALNTVIQLARAPPCSAATTAGDAVERREDCPTPRPARCERRTFDWR